MSSPNAAAVFRFAARLALVTVALAASGPPRPTADRIADTNSESAAVAGVRARPCTRQSGDEWFRVATGALSQAMPGLGYSVSLQNVMTLIASQPAVVTRTELFGRWVDLLNQAIDMQGWEAGRDPAGNLAGAQRPDQRMRRRVPGPRARHAVHRRRAS
jgi:hypothetical protein